MDDTTLLFGACENCMSTLQDDSIDFVFCDLPYCVSACEWDTPIDLNWMWQELWRVCKENAPVALTATQPFATDLICSQRQHFKYEWIWLKSRPTNPMQARYMPLKIHENVLIFYRQPPVYNPQRSRPHHKSLIAKTETRKGYKSEFYGVTNNTFEFQRHHPDGRLPFSVQNWGSVNTSSSERYHPSQKPVAMMADLIKTYTDENGIVLDFCMGSGSTGVAAKETGRKFIGIERDRKYYDIASKRLKSATMQYGLIED